MTAQRDDGLESPELASPDSRASIERKVIAAEGDRVTYASLDRALGYENDPTASGLHEWYASIEHQPVATLSEEHLARALRQNVYPAVTLPAALTLLERDPWVGWMFPTELAHGFERVPAHVWRTYPELRRRGAAVIWRLMNQTPPDDVTPQTFEKLRELLTVVNRTIAEASMKRVYLQVGDGPRVVQEDEDELVIGSGPTAAVYAKELASEHAWVRRSASGWEVVAVGGEVMLNGRFVTVAPLKPGDRLELGAVVVTFGEAE